MKEVFSLLIKDSGLLWEGILQTSYMVSISMLLGALFGIPLGVGVVVTEEGNILENKAINLILSTFINITRSIPFIILMVALIPLTRMIVGTSIGTSAAVVSLTIGAVPFIGRIVEGALKEVDGGVVEAAQAMGANPWEIISKVLLPEALPSLVLGLTITAISLIGYSAIAGAIGAGGLGDIAIRYGYHRFQTDIMIKTVVLLVVIVQIIQNLGTYLARRLDHS
ncbi:methionine ABC transporter permease [Orenia metallireducens]|jgi:D-methionine transport system permease protein|uniref:Methionine ABC transporter permease n=1 Tax=Orenia metallireducens TaxID=1413210 RepID=A0A1C0ABF0_9FIRM|nr:methionine ABC transporter permease [Orenia metallireducens]OCL27690.1 methionine ABC transporter permease [Orenia metallireducens]